MKLQPFHIFLALPLTLPQLIALQDMVLQHQREACGAIKLVSRFLSFRRREQSKFSTTSGGRTPGKFAVATKRTRNRRRTRSALRTLAECLWFYCADSPLLFSWRFSSSVGIRRRTRKPIGNHCVQRWRKSWDSLSDAMDLVSDRRWNVIVWNAAQGNTPMFLLHSACRITTG